MQKPFNDILNNSQRPDLREASQIRVVQFVPHFVPYATGSVLVSFGNTRVICGATFEKKVPSWMIHQGVQGGWVSAEYSMLPYSTQDRKPREISRGKPDGRGIEIQRLIGRAMRAVLDLSKMPGYTLWLDCDVIQADGGTRTASITGAYVAAKLAVNTFLKNKIFLQDPFKDSVAAISVGICQGRVVTDLCYEEDSQAQVDCNIIMTGSGKLVEIQSAGEESTFDEAELHEMLSLAKKSIRELTDLQGEVLSCNS